VNRASFPRQPARIVARIRRLAPGVRLALLATPLLVLGTVALAQPPLAQPLDYHRFADTRAWLGVPNFANVVSNGLFAIFGFAGLRYLMGPEGRARLPGRAERAPWVAFFVAGIAVGLASAYYHAVIPGDVARLESASLTALNPPLAVDRLPIAVAVAALVAGFVGDRLGALAGLATLVAIAGLGVSSVLVWAAYDDLRPYLALRIGAVAVLPLLCVLFPGRRTRFRHLAWMILWTAAASVAELGDRAIHAASGEMVSGHTLKHLLAALPFRVAQAMLASCDGALSRGRGMPT